MNRRNVIKTILSAPAAIAVAAAARLPLKSGRTRFPKPQTVRQAEIAEIVGLHNQIETRAANIRRRLEAGADFESGKWGLSTACQTPLSWYEENGGIGETSDCDSLGSIVGLEIQTADYIREFQEKFPHLAHQMWA